MDGSGLDQLVLLMEGVVIFILNRSEFGKYRFFQSAGVPADSDIRVMSDQISIFSQ